MRIARTFSWGRVGLAVAALAWLPANPAGGQEDEPVEGESGPTVVLRAVPLQEIGPRAEAGRAELEQLRQDAPTSAELDAVQSDLDEALERLREQQTQLEAQLAQPGAIEGLVETDREWLAFRDRLQSRQDQLQAAGAYLETGLGDIRDREQIWLQTLGEARQSQAPAIVIQGIKGFQTDLRETARTLRARRDRVLELQGTALQAREQVVNARKRIAQTQEDLLANLFSRDQLPLWEVGPGEEDAGQIIERLRAEVQGQLEATARLAAEQRERGLLHLMLVLAIGAVLRAARTRTRDWPREDPRMERVASVFEHPYAIALLVGLASTSSIYASPPRAVREISQLMLLFPALVVISPLIERALRPALLVLAGLYLLDQVRDVLEGLPVLARALFVLQMLLASGSSVWLLLRARRGSPPLGDEHAQARRMGPTVLRAAIGVFAFAAFCSVLGFDRLARLLGNGVLGSAYVGILIYAGVQTAQAVFAFALRSRYTRWLRSLRANAEFLERGSHNLLALGGFVGWCAVTLELFGLRESVATGFGSVVNTELGLGAISFSLGDILAFLITVALALGLARAVQAFLEADVYPRLETPRGTAYAFSTILRYTLILVGFLVAVGAIGFDVDRLTVLIGAFGVGLGFGLQNVINNFVSGLILLFERPIQIGDAIEVEGVMGHVHRIGIRASVVRTFDGAEVTVPNGTLLSQRLTNWTRSDRHRRVEIPVGVAYGTDPDQVLELLLGVASAHEQILSDPRPQAIFQGFGDSSLDFLLRCWVTDNDNWVAVRSELVLSIHRSLHEHGIQIPFPQRDLHVRHLPGAAEALPDRVGATGR